MERTEAYTSPIEGEYSSIQEELGNVLCQILGWSVDKEDIIVEYFRNGDDFVVKLRQQWNDWLEGLPYEDKIFLLKALRTELDKRGLQKVRVEYSEHSKDYSGRNNVRLVFNPHWRRYEGIQVYFRTHTQDRRDTPYQEEKERINLSIEHVPFPWECPW